MIRCAIIGLGYWGKNILRNIENNNGLKLTYVVDEDVNIINQYLKQSKFKVLSNYYDIEVNEIDAVFIVSNSSQHYQITKYFLLKNIHVFCEKPGLLTLVESNSIRKILQDNSSLVYFVGYTFMYNNYIDHIKEVLRSNSLGTIYYANFYRSGLGPIRSDVSVIYDLAVHDISIANYLFGKPMFVSAHGMGYFNSTHFDTIDVKILYENNVLVSLKSSWLEPVKKREINIVGTLKMVLFEDTNLLEKVKIYNKGVSYQRNDGEYSSFQASLIDGDITIPNVPFSEPLQNEINQFVTCISKKQEPKTNLQFVKEVLYVTEAINKSIHNDSRFVPVAHNE